MKKEPKTRMTGFRFAEPMMELIVGFAKFLGITRTKLVEDAVVMAANTHTLGTKSLVCAIGELSPAATARTHPSRSESCQATTAKAKR